MACCKIKLIGTLIIGWVRFFFFWLCLLLLLEFVNDICYILSWPLCFNNLLNILSVGFFCFLLNFRLLLGLRWGRKSIKVHLQLPRQTIILWLWLYEGPILLFLSRKSYRLCQSWLSAGILQRLYNAKKRKGFLMRAQLDSTF